MCQCFFLIAAGIFLPRQFLANSAYRNNCLRVTKLVLKCHKNEYVSKLIRFGYLFVLLYSENAFKVGAGHGKIGFAMAERSFAMAELLAMARKIGHGQILPWKIAMARFFSKNA